MDHLRSVASLFVVVLVAQLAACNGGSGGVAPPPSPPPSPTPGPSPPPGPPPPPPGPGAGVGLQRVASGLSFPLFLTAPAGDGRLFIVEKGGAVRIVKNGELLSTPFLDLRGQVSTGSEQGLLSIAFHPGYATNGRFFVSYTDLNGDSRIVEYRVSSDPDRAAAQPVRTVLGVDQPFANHNGGLILFGPDGKLYIGFGDGGSGGDPQDNAENLGSLLGKILRIDVDAGSPYAVPPDNPFVGRAGARPEVWAYGLRNPWRFSFDRSTGDLYVADVGQNRFEELNAVAAGAQAGVNYGWDVMEATHCFEPSVGCNRDGLTQPVLEYDNTPAACSVTGGYVYRGSAVPSLSGIYFYSDYCGGFVRSFRFQGGQAVDQQRRTDLEPDNANVPSFGEDSAGELYLLTAQGDVYKFVAR